MQIEAEVLQPEYELYNSQCQSSCRLFLALCGREGSLAAVQNILKEKRFGRGLHQPTDPDAAPILLQVMRALNAHECPDCDEGASGVIELEGWSVSWFTFRSWTFMPRYLFDMGPRTVNLHFHQLTIIMKPPD